VRRTCLLVVAALLLALRTAFAAVDANSASADDLETIPGIGPATAKRIVEERAKGPFKGLEDLHVRVRGIGEARVRKMAAAGLTVVPGAVPAPSRRDEARAARDARDARDARPAAGGAAGAVSAEPRSMRRPPSGPVVHEGGSPARPR
jgi:competence protein ComEA